MLTCTGTITLKEIVDDLNLKQYIINDKGILWTAKDYLIGDVMTESNNIYICIRDHTGLAGNVTDGSPTQGNQTAWIGVSSGGYVSDTAKAAYVPDTTLGNYFEYTLDQDTTISAMLNPTPGSTGTIQINQDATGSWVTTWDASYIFPAGLPVENITADAYNIFKYTISGSKVFIEYVLDGI